MQFEWESGERRRWCSIPMEELADHPQRKIGRVIIEQTPADVMKLVGNMMADEVVENNRRGEITRWVLPAGPRQQYETFVERVVRDRISLKNLHVFHMDEWLDWNGRPYPYGNHHACLRGIMDHLFYEKLPAELTVPESQRVWPNLSDLDELDRRIEQIGGVDTVWAGVGFKGLVAFNEAPRDTYYPITADEYARSKTRVVKITDETIVTQSHRRWGGNTDLVPPMALTIGFQSMLNTRRVVFMIATGAWKQTVVRVLLFSGETLEYPATLMTNRVANCVLAMDRFTATHPLESYEKSMLQEGW